MGNFELHVLKGNREGQFRPLETGAIILGRTSDADWNFPLDKRISSRHCQILCNANECSIVDLGSRNGTYLNGQRIVERHPLKAGDVIGIGNTQIELREIPQASEPSRPFSPIVDFFSDVDHKEDIDPDKDEVDRDVDKVNRDDAKQPLGQQLQPDWNAESKDIPNEIAKDTPNQEKPPPGVVQCRMRQVSDDGHGKLCWIGVDQSMIIGRGEWNDYGFPDDLKMSGEHFRVKLQWDGCIIEDLQSKHGTWVNGQRIERCGLVNGSRVLAGNTLFEVEILGIDHSASSIASPAPPSRIAPGHASASDKSIAIRSPLPGNIQRVLGKWENEPAPVDWLERLLLQKGNVYLLLDLMRIDIELPMDSLEEPDTLFDWLSAPASRKTPCLFDLRTWPEWPTAVDEAWGSDAMMILTSQKSKEELLAELRDLLRGPADHRLPADGIRGICWPSVLRPLIEVNANGFVEECFQGMDAVWMEGSEDPLVWDWIGKPTVLDPLCKAMGIRVRDLPVAEGKGVTV